MPQSPGRLRLLPAYTGLHVRAHCRVYYYVRLLPLCCLAFVVPAWAANPGLDGLLKTIEDRYNKAQTIKLSFSETYAGKGRPSQSESGTLYLRKPGRMLWSYSQPVGKIFLSDGKSVFQFVPGDREAQKSKLRESDDMRAPLAFLLGKLDFSKEFRSFETRPEGAETWITATPKSPDLVYSKVEFLASPNGEIHRVRVTGQDQSQLEFVFSNEQMNAPVPQDLFVFRPPAGVPIVESDR
jgi:outer membrane lipoprotein carrier protein